MRGRPSIAWAVVADQADTATECIFGVWAIWVARAGRPVVHQDWSSAGIAALLDTKAAPARAVNDLFQSAYTLALSNV
jgi:hypothetical protein